MGGRQGYTGHVRPTVENHISIDVRRLAKANMLHSGTRIKVTGGNPEYSFIVEVATGSLAVRHGPGLAQNIALEYTPCHLGGKRVWFKCPNCYARRAKLLLGGEGLYCRGCYGLPYRSQQRGDLDNLIVQRDKLMAKKERRMRKTKRTVLEDRINALDEKIDNTMYSRFGRRF